MSPKCTFLSAAMASIVVAALSTSARPQGLDILIELECDAFRKNPNGSWTLTRKTEVKYRISSIFLEPSTFRKNDIDVFGAELTSVLERNCVQPSKKK